MAYEWPYGKRNLNVKYETWVPKTKQYAAEDIKVGAADFSF